MVSKCPSGEVRRSGMCVRKDYDEHTLKALRQIGVKKDRTYLASAEERNVITGEDFKNSMEALNYAVSHNLQERGYAGMRGKRLYELADRTPYPFTVSLGIPDELHSGEEDCRIVEVGKDTSRYPEKVYLCERKIDTGTKTPMELTVAMTYPRKTFIVESGAGIPRERREKQVLNYLERMKERKGYISP